LLVGYTPGGRLFFCDIPNAGCALGAVDSSSGSEWFVIRLFAAVACFNF
jgi:hypothetical protein